MVSNLRNADGVVIVFDLTSHDSFTDVSDWIQKARQQLGQDDEVKEDDGQTGRVPMVVVGNKLDLCDKPQRNDRMV